MAASTKGLTKTQRVQENRRYQASLKARKRERRERHEAQALAAITAAREHMEIEAAWEQAQAMKRSKKKGTANVVENMRGLGYDLRPGYHEYHAKHSWCHDGPITDLWMKVGGTS